MTEARPMKCTFCVDSGWVCENHPERVAGRARVFVRRLWYALPNPSDADTPPLPSDFTDDDDATRH